MNALAPHRAESTELRLVGLFRHGKLLRPEQAKQFDNLVRLALSERRLYWQNRAIMADAEERGDLEYYRRMKAEGKRLWSNAKWHLAKARERLE